MAEQIILKLGGRCPNKAALSVGFQVAKGASLPVRALYLENEELLKASRFSFSKEVGFCGSRRGFELHELKKENKIAMRALEREVRRRSEAARIEADFLTLTENVGAQFHEYCQSENIIVMGEHQSARQLTRDYIHLKESGCRGGILMAGPRAQVGSGPLVILVHSYEAWQEGLGMLRDYLQTLEQTVVLLCIGDVIDREDDLRADIEEDFFGDLIVYGMKRLDQSRLLWEIGHFKTGLLYLLKGCPLTAEKDGFEVLLNLFRCPLLVSL